MDVLSDHGRRFLSATAPEHTDVQAEMADFADGMGFPIIGPESGSVLRLLARLTDAERVFEFGSGFGYSATWFLRGGADHVVCTEFDESEAEQGVAFADEYGYGDRVTFEVGDAMETVERYDGPFDAVLVDHQKSRYADAYEVVRPKLRPGSVVVADNVTAGPIDFGNLLAYFEEETKLPPDDDETRGIAEYVELVRDDADLDTAILPVGSGIAVSTVLDA